jgi:membrane protein YdbS with pleckstrin-like domain
MDMKKQFQLQEGEKIEKDIKPLPVLKWYFFIIPSVGFFFFTLFFSWIFFLPRISFISSLFLLFTLIFIGILYLIANNRYNYQHYWITNKRVLYRKGLLGYTISSIPLERISDVIVSRTFWERVFGFGSVMIQSLAGQITYRNRLGSEGSLLAVPDPEGTQKLIFDLIKKKRKSEKLSF